VSVSDKRTSLLRSKIKCRRKKINSFNVDSPVYQHVFFRSSYENFSVRAASSLPPSSLPSPHTELRRRRRQLPPTTAAPKRTAAATAALDSTPCSRREWNALKGRTRWASSERHGRRPSAVGAAKPLLRRGCLREGPKKAARRPEL
jgi:hypothetical protein